MKTITGIDSKLGHQFLVLIVSGLIVSTAFAQELESASIDVFRLLMGLFGGLALFLFGMDQMAEALKAVDTIRPEMISTRNWWPSFLSMPVVNFIDSAS